MKIVFFETMPGEEAYFRSASTIPAGTELEFHTDTLSPQTVGRAAGADVVSVFVKSELTPDVLAQLPDLKLITTRSMGYEHIAVSDAKGRGMKVRNVTTYAAHPVAEFTFALLLAVARHLYPASEQMREASDFSNVQFVGKDLIGATLGVVGTGRIGREVVKIAKGFSMQVIAHDALPDAAFATDIGFRYVPMDELLATSDVITLHVPALPETVHMIDATAFGKMKKGSILINTSRGEVIDTPALVAALKDGTLWGAGLDVLEAERELADKADALQKGATSLYRTLVADNALLDLPNVIVTPHMAYNTEKSRIEIMRATAQSIGDWAADKEQPYL
ncbi:MAG TPA: NAD(P)-dependent oxidoreductase [Candidatus Paceibacterota bacterium]|nr:NAD(P)-dependent oxidoreductase [Candidatus Paceibacterota bacterium]